GLSVISELAAWCSGSNGMVQRTINGKDWENVSPKGYANKDFRAVHAYDENTALLLSIADSAVILRTTDAGKSWNKVYENNTPGIFFDDFDFQGHRGFAIADPLPSGDKYDHFFIISQDSGKTWYPMRNHVFRNNAKDAGLFSASASNVIIDGESLNAICGGDSAMFLFSKHGKIKLPIKSGGAFGPYSMDRLGRCYAVVGGNYAKKEWSDSIACYSKNHGKDWNLFQSMPHGYKSSIKFFKNHKQLIAVGTTGIDISTNFGKTWKQVSKTSFNTVEVFRNTIWMVGNDGIKATFTTQKLKKLSIPF
ncbi:MAG: hypothetical protein P8O20_04375, partial [Bacteroidia bacterium]|nr:hypothetical protein [Bacteroidia bacterium]